MTSAPSFQNPGVHSPSSPCLAPSPVPFNTLCCSIPCFLPSLVPLHPLSPFIPCPARSFFSLHPLFPLHPLSLPWSPPSLVPLHPVPPSSHRPAVLCPQPACGLSSKLPTSRGWSLFSPFLLARTWCSPAPGIASCCSKNSGRYRGPFLHPTAPRQGALVFKCGPCAHPMGWCGGVNPSCCSTEPNELSLSW